MLCKLLFCHEDNCTASFESLEVLNSHMIIGNHTFPAIISSYDKVKMAFTGRLLDGASAHSHDNINSMQLNSKSKVGHCQWVMQLVQDSMGTMCTPQYFQTRPPPPTVSTYYSN